MQLSFNTLDTYAKGIGNLTQNVHTVIHPKTSRYLSIGLASWTNMCDICNTLLPPNKTRQVILCTYIKLNLIINILKNQPLLYFPAFILLNISKRS